MLAYGKGGGGVKERGKRESNGGRMEGEREGRRREREKSLISFWCIFIKTMHNITTPLIMQKL